MTELLEIQEPARAAWSSLRDELRTILGARLVAVWGHGSSIGIGAGPGHLGDLDTHVIVAERPDDMTARKLENVADRITKEHGLETDTWYVHIGDARGTDPPSHAWREGRRDTSWALHRAHWLAGRYVGLYGPEPEAIVKPPTWEELEGELSRELEHIERHVLEGDTDRYEATYAILNGSRVLHSVGTRVITISKRDAGTWALEHLPPRWHAAVGAAIRSYDGRFTHDDVQLLAAEMGPFVAFAREQLPDAGDRPAGELPRWSGS